MLASNTYREDPQPEKTMAAAIDDGITITDGGKKDVVDPDKMRVL